METENVQIQNPAGNAQSSSGTKSAAAAVSSGTKSAAGLTQTGSEEENTQDTDSVSEVTAFTMAAADTMVLSVNVDELDINSAAVGQQAEITLDAIEGERFSGTVTKVGSSASSSAMRISSSRSRTAPAASRRSSSSPACPSPGAA